MTDEDNSGVFEEAAAPITEDMGSAQVDTEPTEVTQEVQETDQAMNFRKLRESNEQLQRDREQDRQMMMAMQTEMLKRGEGPPSDVAEPDEFAGLDKSDWSTIEQTEKLAARIADARFEKKWAEAEAKRKLEETPERLKKRFQDFSDVVTKDNVKQLQALEPDLAHALSLIGDEEAKAVAAYKYIKAFVPQAAETTAAKARIQKNASQPKSLSSAGGASPLSQAGTFEQGLTPDLKKQLLAEMRTCARQS